MPLAHSLPEKVQATYRLNDLIEKRKILGAGFLNRLLQHSSYSASVALTTRKIAKVNISKYLP